MKQDTPTNFIPDSSIYDSIVSLGYQGTLKAIARPASPVSGISGFLFGIPEEESVELTSDSTNHYLEDNTAIQDHIALNPEQITLKGSVYEMLIPSYSAMPAPLGKSNPLVPSSLYAPSTKTKGDEDAPIPTVQPSTTAYNRWKNAGAIQNGAQKKAFDYFYQLWRGRMLFSVETPWGVFRDMHIINFNPTQSKESNEVTNITVTFKRLRFAGTSTETSGQLFERSETQNQQLSKNSNAGGNPTQQTEVDTNKELQWLG